MTTFLACSTCNERQWEEYGRRMATSFARHWPSLVPLHVYAEGFHERSNLFRMLDLDEAAPWLSPWKAERTAAQRGVVQGRYNYRLDAAKFVHKVATIGAVSVYGYDVLVWLDADTVTHERVTTDRLDSLLPDGAPIAWLDRPKKYPECGFMMLRLQACSELIRSWVECYRSGEVFKLPETHDSFVLWQLVKAAGITPHSLSGEARNARHPFVVSDLGSRMDHCKGTLRKQRGRSLPTDLSPQRTEAYWR
jgi:hypothetical protein